MLALRQQLFTFAIVGALATGVQYLVLVALAELGIHPVVASAIGFTGSALLNYSLNRHWTFGRKVSHGQALPRFLTVAACGLALNSLIMALCYSAAGFHYLLAQVVATGAVFFWSFTGNRLWSFR